MGYRILVDENIDPVTAELLCERGHNAVHVQATVGKGTSDQSVAEYARENSYAILTNDTDFLRSGPSQTTVLYCPEHAMRAGKIARLIDKLAEMIPDQADLPAITWVTEETRS
ncbi:MAG: DUF5615 family PIN-like protein [Haloarculaceae archaeon]